MSEAEWLNTTETAAALGVSESTILRMAASGKLPYVHRTPGPVGRYLFSRQVVELVAEQQSKPRRIGAS